MYRLSKSKLPLNNPELYLNILHTEIVVKSPFTEFSARLFKLPLRAGWPGSDRNKLNTGCHCLLASSPLNLETSGDEIAFITKEFLTDQSRVVDSVMSRLPR